MSWDLRHAALIAGCAFASSAAPPRSSGEMQRRALAAAPAEPSGRRGARITARRCGWLSNPTPGNWELFDRGGEWLLGAQGGY